MVELVHARRNNWEAFNSFSQTPLDGRLSEINARLIPGMSLDEARNMMDKANNESRIGLEPIDVEAFSYQIHGLAHVLRFLGDAHVAPGHVDNVARHIFRVMANGDEIFKAEPHESTNIEMRQVFHLATIMHDFGEIVREFGSFAKEAEQDHKLDEDQQLTVEEKATLRAHAKEHIYQTERKISAFGLTLAYTAAYLQQPELHSDTILELRRISGANADGTLDKSNPVSTTKAMQIISDYIDAFDMPAVDDAGADMIEKRVDLMMRYYDMAEAYLGVIGPAVKVMQKADGSDYIYRVMGKDGAVPYDESWNWRILGAHGRNEGELGDVNRQGDLSIVEHIAEMVQKHMLARSIDLIKKNPDIISRDTNAPDAKMAGTPEMQTVKKQLLAQERQTRRNTFNLHAWQANARHEKADPQTLRGMDNALADDTLTARKALIVYTAAWLATGSNARIMREDKFVLTNTPLLMQRSVPKALQEHVRLLDQLQKMMLSPRNIQTSFSVLLDRLEHEHSGKPEKALALTEIRAGANFIESTFHDFSKKRLEIQKRRKLASKKGQAFQIRNNQLS
ncbi:MAG: hypothetical protein OXT65_03970 [Alphaproteobacteria bacterium]|nr:hypothetical protein [Alphaproteobacteria bacterium]